MAPAKPPMRRQCWSEAYAASEPVDGTGQQRYGINVGVSSWSPTWPISAFGKAGLSCLQTAQLKKQCFTFESTQNMECFLNRWRLREAGLPYSTRCRASLAGRGKQAERKNERCHPPDSGEGIFHWPLIFLIDPRSDNLVMSIFRGAHCGLGPM